MEKTVAIKPGPEKRDKHSLTNTKEWKKRREMGIDVVKEGVNNGWYQESVRSKKRRGDDAIFVREESTTATTHNTTPGTWSMRLLCFRSIRVNQSNSIQMNPYGCRQIHPWARRQCMIYMIGSWESLSGLKHCWDVNHTMHNAERSNTETMQCILLMLHK